jgi:hypothetical protein
MTSLRLEGGPKSEAKLRVRMALQELLGDQREARRERRLPYFGAATVTPAISPTVNLSAFVRDLSSGGIGLVHFMPLNVGEVVVTMQLSRGRSVQMVTEIVWCRDFADGWFASGGKFLDALQL